MVLTCKVTQVLAAAGLLLADAGLGGARPFRAPVTTEAWLA
jgi:hypothetical protein